MRLRPYLFCLSLALLASAACSESPTTAPAVPRPQLVGVDPNDFMGSIRCAAPLADDANAGSADAGPELDCQVDSDLDPDAARSYVATLYDVTPAADGSVPNPGTPLASSPPTPCLLPVTFSYVVEGHRYLAQVDAYHERPKCLTPISAGSRLLSDVAGARVVPRWTATCGDYPPSPYVEPGTDSAGAAGTASSEAQPPGVVSYAGLTRTPHDCKLGLVPTDAN